ncbi:MAG: PKD domain-containing protein [Polyangia bacterium]
MKNLAWLLSLVVGAALFTLSSSGCSERTNAPAFGGARVRTYVQLPADGNYTVTVTITGDGITDPIVVPLTEVGNQWVANLNDIPAGTNRTFTLSVLDASGTVIYSGVATGVTITSGQTASVSIGGQQTNAPPATDGASPVIDALIASSVTVSDGATVALSVSAHDPNANNTLSYLWTSPSGTFDSANTSSTNWTAPGTDGIYRITVQVQNNQGAQTTMSVDITVCTQTDAGSTATISVTLNNWPVVSGVTSTQGRIDVGDTTALDCTATDADGDPLTYSWSTDSGCVGTFSASNVKSPTFTLGNTLPALGTCTFSVTVSDGRGGTGTGSLTITAAPAPPVISPPQIVSSSQSAQSVVAGQTVTLSVVATDPQSTAMTRGAPSGRRSTWALAVSRWCGLRRSTSWRRCRSRRRSPMRGGHRQCRASPSERPRLLRTGLPTRASTERVTAVIVATVPGIRIAPFPVRHCTTAATDKPAFSPVRPVSARP